MEVQDNWGFVLTRHVNSNVTNMYWNEACKSIRKVYPDVPIMVVDDNSDPAFLYTDIPLDGITVVQSEYKGRGEILAYYYFWTLRPFDKAVVIHDSVFIQHKIRAILDPVLASLQTVRFCWYFSHIYDAPDVETFFIRCTESSVVDDWAHFHNQKREKWLGCFGVMSVVTHGFIDMLQQKHHFFKILDHVFSRNERYNIERVFASVCCMEDELACDALFGNIFDHPKSFDYNWEDYERGIYNPDRHPVLKLWTGR